MKYFEINIQKEMITSHCSVIKLIVYKQLQLIKM